MKKYRLEVLKSSDNSFHFDDEYGYQDREIEIRSMTIDNNENLFIKFDQILGEKEWTKAIITMIDKLGRRSSTKEISISSVAETGKSYSNRLDSNPKWLGISMFLKSVEGDMVEIEIEFI